jgi:hypothetical protein
VNKIERVNNLLSEILDLFLALCLKLFEQISKSKITCHEEPINNGITYKNFRKTVLKNLNSVVSPGGTVADR